MILQVDAALDLSHTQNIGRMIKAHFPHSQVGRCYYKQGNVTLKKLQHLDLGLSSVDVVELRKHCLEIFLLVLLISYEIWYL